MTNLADFAAALRARGLTKTPAAKAAPSGTTLAEKIILAGKKRRGLGTITEPTDPVARAIVAAAKKARGESV